MQTEAIQPDIHGAIMALADAVRSPPEVPALMTAEEAAAALGICDKVFRAEVRAKKIKFIMIGRRKKFLAADLSAYIEQQRNAAPCPSTSRKARRTSTTTSSSKVFDITARLASTTAKKR